MAFLLEQAGDKIGKGIFDAGLEAVGDDVNKGVLGVAEKIPIIGDGIKTLVKDYNIAGDKVSGFVDDLMGKHEIPAEHKDQIMKQFETDRTHNKLYNDLKFSDDGKIKPNQKIVRMRPPKAPESILKNELFDSNKNLRSKFINPDGTLNLENLEKGDPDILKNRIESETRHGFDLDAERPSKTQSPQHTETDHPKFSNIEKNKLIPTPAGEITDPEDIGNITGLTQDEVFDKFFDALTEDEPVGDKGDEYLESIYREIGFKPEDIKGGQLEDLAGAPEVDDIALKFYENTNFESPNQVISNLNELSPADVEDLQEYNEVATPDVQVKSTEALTFDILKDKNEIPEITNKLKTNGLKIEGLEKLDKTEIKKYADSTRKYYNRDAFNNAPKRIKDFGLEKTPDQFKKLEEQKKFTGEGRKLGSDPPNIQSKPKILSRESTDIDLDKIPTGEKVTAFSSLDNPPSTFKKLADTIKEGLSDMSEDGIAKIKDIYGALTWKEIATIGLSGGASIAGVIANMKVAEEIRTGLTKMPKELRESLGIDLGLFDTVASLEPSNTSITGIMDTMTKLYKLSQQISPNAQKAKEAINIFNQPSSSVITDNDNKRKMDKAELANEKGLENTKKEAMKLKKQLEIAKKEDEIIKKKEKEDEIDEENKAVAERKAGQDAQRSRKIIGGDEVHKDPVPPTTNTTTSDKTETDNENDKSVNINIINDSSIPDSNAGILKLNPKPIISKGDNFLEAAQKIQKPKNNMLTDSEFLKKKLEPKSGTRFKIK